MGKLGLEPRIGSLTRILRKIADKCFTKLAIFYRLFQLGYFPIYDFSHHQLLLGGSLTHFIISIILQCFLEID